MWSKQWLILSMQNILNCYASVPLVLLYSKVMPEEDTDSWNMLGAWK